MVMMRLRFLVFAAALLLFAIPVTAEEVSQLPAIRPFASARVQFAFALQDQVMLVGQGVLAGDRKHVAMAQYDPDITLEVVTIGQYVYLRVGDADRWLVSSADPRSVPGDPPDLATIGATDTVEQITLEGDAEVEGAPATQYRLRLRPQPAADAPGENPPAAYFVDLFVGREDGYLHKYQVTRPGDGSEGGEAASVAAFVYSNFDEPVVVNTPPSNLVDPLVVGR